MSTSHLFRKTGRLGAGLLIAVWISCSSGDPAKRPPPPSAAPAPSAGKPAPAAPGGHPGSATGQAGPKPAPPKRSSKEAEEIFASMKKTYSTCDSYSDKGTIWRTESLDSGFVREYPVDRVFYTDFKRPDQFRFEHHDLIPFTGDMHTTVAWARGDDVRMSEPRVEYIPKESTGNDEADESESEAGEKKEAADEEADDVVGRSGDDLWDFDYEVREVEPSWRSIGEQVAEASDISALLMPNKMQTLGKGIAALENLQVEPEETVAGAPCFRIVGEFEESPSEVFPDTPFMDFTKKMKIIGRTTVWIEKKRRVIRKIHVATQTIRLGRIHVPGGGSFRIPDMDYEFTRTFEPRLNEDIKWHDLVYDVAGATEGPTQGTASWHNDEFKPTDKSAEDARKAGAEIMADMAKVYAACKSYQDRGIIEAASIDRDQPLARRLQFETAFVRPDGFRLEYREETKDAVWTRHIICRDAKGIRCWCHLQTGIEDQESMSSAMEELGFHSKVPLDAIPGLLMPTQFSGTYVSTAMNMTLLGEQDVDGKRCYKVRGTDRLEWSLTLWIEKKRKLLRRLQAKFHGYDVPVWVTATVETRLNKKVSEKYLGLGSPKSAGGSAAGS